MEEREERMKERAQEHKEYLARKQAREEREATMTTEKIEEERKQYEARKQAREDWGGAMMTTEERVEERKKYEARRKVREEREHKKLEVWDCPRCNKNGHMLNHCPRPKTKKELREDDRLKNEARHQTRAQAKLEDLECASQSTASTAMTATSGRAKHNISAVEPRWADLDDQTVPDSWEDLVATVDSMDSVAQGCPPAREETQGNR